jgi:hypothetical protein
MSNGRQAIGDIPMNEMEAIQKLRDGGFHAQTRDWSSGHSIFVGLDAFNKGGITAWRHSRYIYQAESSWRVIDCVTEIDSFPSLEEAVTHVMAALKREQGTAG